MPPASSGERAWDLRRFRFGRGGVGIRWLVVVATPIAVWSTGIVGASGNGPSTQATTSPASTQAAAAAPPRPPLTADEQREADRLYAAAISGDTEAAASAAEQLVRRVGHARPDMVRSVAFCPHPRVRAAALVRLAAWARPVDVTECVGPVIRSDPEPAVRVAALIGLGEMRRPSIEAWDLLPDLVPLVVHDDPGVRAAADRVFERIAYVKLSSFDLRNAAEPERRRALARLQEFAKSPARRERYLEWLAEMEAKRAGPATRRGGE